MSNTLDLELGRNFFLGKSFTFRPIIGVRAAWLHQHTKVDYQFSPIVTSALGKGELFAPLPYPAFSFLPLNSIPAGGTFSTLRQFSGQNNYSGVGLRAGFDMNWNFMDHFCAYSTFSGSVLYGFFDIDETFSTINSETNSPNPTDNGFIDFLFTLDNDYHRTRTNLQVLLGLMWHTGFNNDKQHLSIGVSYEVNEWFQQNELRNFQVGFPAFDNNMGSPITNYSVSDSRTSGDLGLHGVNVDVKFDF